MYSVYKIYQADKLVLVTYSDLIPEFTDTTKLKLIMNGPTIPISLFEDYFKTPELFSITNIYMKTTSKIINKTFNKKRNYVFSI